MKAVQKHVVKARVRVQDRFVFCPDKLMIGFDAATYVLADVVDVILCVDPFHDVIRSFVVSRANVTFLL